MTVRATTLRLAISASAIALFALPSAASAATCVWNGGTGNWSPAGGWSACAVPTSADDVSILLGGSVVNITNFSANAATINLGGGNSLNLSNSDLRVFNGAITNNGTFNIAANSNLINAGGPITVGGTGVFALNDIAGVARIYGGSWTFGSGQTVRGSGQLGINNGIFSNAGLVSADVNARNLDIDATGGSGGLGGGGFGTGGNAGFYNTGTMQATGGGILSFQSGLYENSAAGVIRALNGSIVTLGSDSRIVGGTLTSVGTGVINAHGVSNYLTNVTLSSGSNLSVQNDDLRVNTSLVNNGTITLGGAAGTASLINETGTLTISGSGTIVLDNSLGAARIYGNNIVFGSNQSLRGAGQLGINAATVTNNGLFSANTGSNLDIDVTGGSGGLGGGGVGTGGNAGLLNNNIMEATGNSTISFESGLYENALAGIIRATVGSTINLNSDSRIVGGTLTSDATSSIHAFGTTQYLTNVTLSAGSNLLVQNDDLRVNTTLTNNGTITLGGAAGIASLINESGSLAINGTGTIILDNSAGIARIYSGNITFGAGQTVQGAGQLGVNSATFTINNVFSANAGSTLDFDVTGGSGGLGGGGVGTGGNAGMFNNSTIQATGGSTLAFESGLYENSASGVIQALAGSTVNLNSDSRIVNGTLTSVGTGVINAIGTTQYLTNVTLSSGSNLRVRNDDLRVNTSLVNNGTITLGGAAGIASLINESGTLTISGTGTIVLDNSFGAARIYNGRIIFGSNQSLQGAGQLGINSAIITNNGLFSANSGSNLDIDATGGSGGLGVGNGVGTNTSSALLNNSIMEATGGSTISFESGLYENDAGASIRATNNSFINLNSDARILNGTLTTDATSFINAIGSNQYLNNVTLSVGTNMRVQNDDLRANTTLTNNGTITLGGAAGIASLIGEGGPLTIGGSGSIVLDNSLGGARIYNGTMTFGANHTVSGSGQIGINSLVLTNNGFISADAGTGINIDITGGSGGLGGGGVGTGGNAGLFNTGTIQAANGKTLSMESGRYENSATGTFAASGAGSAFVMNGDANLINLQAGNVLNLGSYISSTTGAASTLNIRGTGANSISTIGTGAAGTNTTVTLSGANSVFNVTNFSTAVNTTLDSTLTTVASSGRLNVLGGRNMTIVAAPNFTNAGVVQLGGGTFGSTNYTNSGLTTGFGTISAPINNTGTVEAAGGTLVTNTILALGTMRSNAGATLNIAGAAANSTAGFLTNNGNLALGTRNVTVASDYTNAAFGLGNAFNAHANVSGTGLINATSATMDLSGPALSGGILNVGNVRTGGSNSTTLTITNNGTATTLRGAVQNTLAPSVALTGADWVIGPNGGSTNVTIGFTGTTAGSLSGQTLNVVNNFDNVADRTIGVTGNVYQVANPIINNASSFINVGPVLVGASVTQALSISNSQVAGAVGFQEGLNAGWGTFTGNAIAGAIGSITNLVAGATNNSNLVLTFDTTSAGSKSGSIDVLLATNGAGTSGFGTLALPTQALAVSSTVITGTVLNPAVATIVTPQPITVAAQRIGGTNTAAITVRNDGAPPSAGLDGSFASATGAVNGSGSFTNIATGMTSGNIMVGVNTTTSGIKTGTATLNFASNLSPNPSVALASQTVNVTGTVTELASAAIFKNAGLGAFAGSGNAFTLDLGPLATNSGVFTTDLGVTNLVVPSAFAELLGGSFTQGSGAGYSFAGNSFTGLVGGTSNLGNLLSFDTTGLANGTYTKQITFNGASSYTGLADIALAPINVSITAQVTGAVAGAVPEPATWMMMLFGFGLVGSSVRRNSLAVARQLV